MKGTCTQQLNGYALDVFEDPLTIRAQIFVDKLTAVSNVAPRSMAAARCQAVQEPRHSHQCTNLGAVAP